MNFKTVIAVCVCVVLTKMISAPVAFAATCLNGGCHRNLTAVKYQHGPVAAEAFRAGGCVMCHIPAGPKCSRARGGDFTMRKKAMCVQCHAPGAGTKHTSGKADCLKCHDPHGSDTSPFFVRRSG